MRYVYFDASSGLSGDMILGALLDLGADRDGFARAVAGLRLPVSVAVREVRRGGLRALKADVAVDRRKPEERTFADVAAVIGRARLKASVKARALEIFRTLFRAEARVHGRPFRKTHLHEAGADDALVDVVGACWLLDALGVGPVTCSPLNVGSGWIETSHGRLPVPPPAVAELLRGVPVYAAGPATELVTPTGAAVIATLARAFLRMPELVYDRVGCGAGDKEFPDLPNVLRAFSGDAAAFDAGRRVHVIEATVDDASPQLLAHFLDVALEAGALDAALSPVVMKKNRLGTKLTLLAEADRIEALVEAVFRETTSIGVRSYPVERRVCARAFRTVRVAGEPVKVKVASSGGRTVNVQPEYEDCLRLARKTGRPLKEILRSAAAAAEKRT